MRFFFQAAARAAPADRNPTSKGHTYQATGVAPHGATTRFSYTVPAGKKLVLEAAQNTALRATAAAPVGLYQSVALIVLIDANQPWLSYAWSLDNTVGARTAMNFAGPVSLLAGEQLITSTSDASTGGTVNYAAAVKGTEYDA